MNYVFRKGECGRRNGTHILVQILQYLRQTNCALWLSFHSAAVACRWNLRLGACVQLAAVKSRDRRTNWWFYQKDVRITFGTPVNNSMGRIIGASLANENAVRNVNIRVSWPDQKHFVATNFKTQICIIFSYWTETGAVFWATMQRIPMPKDSGFY